MDHKEHTESRVYELGYHLVPTLSEEQVPVASAAVRGMIERISKDIIAEEAPVFIDLAYTIVKTVEHKNKRFDDAYFGWIKFEGEPAGIAELEDGLKKDDNVLRYLLTKTIRENTFIAKKFASTKVKEQEEVAVVAQEAEVALEPEVAIEAKGEDALDRVIEELVA